jgi:fucose 4-O-acetylase-like acetyltransferase
LAERTPPERNRYVDFLRALSIGAVVFGHWLIAAPYVEDGRLYLEHMLAVSPWTQWLTWAFQVMPIFFMVGGYSNAASWEAARRSRRDFGEWIAARLRRLIAPVLPLLILWAVIGMLAHRSGVSEKTIKIGSQAALVPLWFLSVYVLVVLLTPLTHAAWRRFGVGSFWMLVFGAVVVDLLRFSGEWPLVGWLNYLFVWLAVHQLGYMWRGERLRGGAAALPWLLGGAVVLVGLVTLGGYPLSMVGVPGDEVSNTLPPSLAMLALGCLQAGLLLTVEQSMRRWLGRTGPWAATILVNGMIMSVYLWHLTAMVLLVGLGYRLGGWGLELQPGSASWWLTRPIWMALLSLVLFVFLLMFSRFERVSEPPRPVVLPLWRAVPGAMAICAGLALVALAGIGGQGPLGIRVSVFVLAFAGAALVGVPIGRRAA